MHNTLSNTLQLSLLTLFMTGCAGGFKAGNPWDPKEGRLFDDGIDMVKDLGGLSGEFAYKAEEELNARVNLSDTVAVVSIQAIQTNKDIDNNEVKRIETSVVNLLHGQNIGETIVLSSEKSALGHALILRHEHRLTGEFICFIRWFENDDHTIGSHFHLSPNSSQLRADIGKLLQIRVKEEKTQGIE